MDETGLYWKMSPDKNLATRQMPGQKKAKARVMAALYYNSTRTECLHIWLIGEAYRPPAFRAAGVNIEAMDFFFLAQQWGLLG